MIDVSIKGIEKLKTTFSAETMGKATIGAMRKLMREMKIEASTDIRKRYTIKKKDLDKYIRLIWPRIRNGMLTAGIHAKGLQLGASYFKMNRNGVAFKHGEIVPAGGNVFIGKWKRQSNRLWLVRRLGLSRFPRESILGPRIADMLDESRGAVTKRVNEKAQKIFESQIWRIMGGK